MNAIIIPAYNEVEYIEASLRAIVDSLATPGNVQILLLDDASTDGTHEAASRVAGVTPIRFETRGGVARCRNVGYSLSEGKEIITHLDGHCWPRPGGIDLLVEDSRTHPDSIIGAANIIAEGRPSKVGAEWQAAVDDALAGKCPVNRAHGLTFAEHRFWFYASVERHLNTPLTRRTLCQANGLTLTRTLLEKMGGWWNLPGMWSGNDVGMGIKAWFLDVPILAETRAEIIHMQKSSSSHATPGWQQTLNKAYVAKMVFSDALYNDFWKPGLGRITKWMPQMDAALDSPAAQVERACFQSQRVRNEQDFMHQFVMPRIRQDAMTKGKEGG